MLHGSLSNASLRFECWALSNTQEAQSHCCSVHPAREAEAKVPTCPGRLPPVYSMRVFTRVKGHVAAAATVRASPPQRNASSFVSFPGERPAPHRWLAGLTAINRTSLSAHMIFLVSVWLQLAVLQPTECGALAYPCLLPLSSHDAIERPPSGFPRRTFGDQAPH